MPAVTGVTVYGLKELQQAARLAGRQATTVVRGELGKAGEPVARDAEELALSKIRRMPHSPEWAEMRVGFTETLVYVAPVKRGVKNRNPEDPRRRPKLADLLLDRALEPALARNIDEVVRRVGTAVDHILAYFERAA